MRGVGGFKGFNDSEIGGFGGRVGNGVGGFKDYTECKEDKRSGIGESEERNKWQEESLYKREPSTGKNPYDLDYDEYFQVRIFSERSLVILLSQHHLLSQNQ